MKPRDALGLIVRVAGLGFVLAGLLDLVHLAIDLLGLPITSNYAHAIIATAGVMYIALGVAVVLAAPLIVRILYGRDNSN